ncbi:HD domain-containing protein [Companilactobacillus metriopterae]|uniref:HD domain-containing protein n=1 Tax=Companilactobacillus metriopterae TaxID=1909267 RepID=UPI00100B93D9|nr:HD domain-containing protein [Companilactobacillus metriopterae]
MDIENKLVQFIKKYMSEDPTGHDVYHSKRVAKMAKKLVNFDKLTLSEEEVKILLSASYLHDVIDDKLTESKDIRIKEVEKFLVDNHVDVDAVMDIILNMSYSDNLKNKKKLSTIGQYVQDADRLDALGAIGIARAFAYGGHKGNLIYDPEINIKKDFDKETYRSQKSTSVNHFYEKLFKLKDLMNTNSGKKIAAKRTAFMEDFIAEFKEEW